MFTEVEVYQYEKIGYLCKKLNSKMRRVIKIMVVVLVVCGAIVGCTDEEKYSENKGIVLTFSQDTISFDTIFTAMSSITKQVRIFNPDKEAIKIDYITLGSGSNSYFRLNVDGDTSLVAKDLTIDGQDSIFVFVRCNIDIQNQNNPVLIEDSIIISFNDKQQKVLLMAYGQDAYYHKPTHVLSQGDSQIKYSLANEGDDCGVILNGNNITWKNDKPHVIIGTCVVDSAFTLNLQSGTKVCMANNSDFWVYKQGSLNAIGTTSEPIYFQGIRNNTRYLSMAGQWGKVWMMAGSKDNNLENVRIKNATIGLVVDTNVSNNPTCKLLNVSIENCSSVGLYARGSYIEGKNVIIQNTASHCLALGLGGNYQFIGCTFANYWSYDNNRNDAVLLLNDWYTASDGSIINRPIEKAEFYNCIIYGSMYEEEIEFDLLGNNAQNIDGTNPTTWLFDHCLIKSKRISNGMTNVSNCIFNRDPLFVDVSTNDLRLNNNSPAIKSGDGIWNTLISQDFYGNYRLDPPSIGAIEYQQLTSKR